MSFTPGSTNILQRPNRDPEQDITALPQTRYGETDPWAQYHRPSSDTLDHMTSPTSHAVPAPPQNPAVTVTEQTQGSESSSSRPPSYSSQPRSHRLSTRFPVKAQDAPPRQTQSSREYPDTNINGAPGQTWHDVELGNDGRIDDAQGETNAEIVDRVQREARPLRIKVIVCAIAAVVLIAVTLTVGGLELRKKHPNDFAKF